MFENRLRFNKVTERLKVILRQRIILMVADIDVSTCPFYSLETDRPTEMIVSQKWLLTFHVRRKLTVTYIQVTHDVYRYDSIITSHLRALNAEDCRSTMTFADGLHYAYTHSFSVAPASSHVTDTLTSNTAISLRFLTHGDNSQQLVIRSGYLLPYLGAGLDLCEGTSPQKRLSKACTPTHLSKKRNKPYLPLPSQPNLVLIYRPGKMEGWIGLCTITASKQSAQQWLF